MTYNSGRASIVRTVHYESELRQAEKNLDFSRSFINVAPGDMPLDVYPDPTGRYQKIIAGMPRKVLLAACRIIGTHIHIGMPDHDTALRVYNRVISHTRQLSNLGDKSNGRRLEIYKIMAPNPDPPIYKTWEEFYQEAVSNGFASDPRSCWALIRISVHGTIEFRMFGGTDDIDLIAAWAKKCHGLCVSR